MLDNGNIVYFIDTRGRKASIKFGIISGSYKREYFVDFLVIREHRYVKGTPIQDFTATQWRKIPKEWRDTAYKIDAGVVWRLSKAEEELLHNGRVNNPDDIKKLYEAGVLVKKEEITGWVVEVELNRNNEYRIIKKIPEWTMTYGDDKRTFVILPEGKVFLTYEEAQKAKEELEAKWKAEADLSDYEWSVREIDKVLKLLHNEELAERYREKLLSMNDIEDLEIKKKEDKVYWRYFSKKTPYTELVV